MPTFNVSRHLSERSCCVIATELFVCHVLKNGEKDMQKQIYMTEDAKKVLSELKDSPATTGEIAQNSHLTPERCQLILTQLVMAGFSECVAGCYKRLH